MYRLEHIAVGKDLAAAVGKVVVCKVDVLLGVSLGRALLREEDLLGGQDGVAEVMLAQEGLAAAARGGVLRELEGYPARDCIVDGCVPLSRGLVFGRGDSAVISVDVGPLLSILGCHFVSLIVVCLFYWLGLQGLVDAQPGVSFS